MTEEEFKTDIVDDLRNQARGAEAGPSRHWTAPELLRNAAAEIERLREALRPFARRAQDAIDLNISYPDGHYPAFVRDCFAARTALGETEG